MENGDVSGLVMHRHISRVISPIGGMLTPVMNIYEAMRGENL